jgi:nucleoside-diphosphate-sugar epimerase
MASTLLIGGTGLISTAITHYLLERGDDVTHYNRGQFDLYPLPPEVRQIRGDRTEYGAFAAQMASAGPFDYVIDMVGYQPADASSVVEVFRGRVAQYIFCSTVDVYRKPASRYPVTEAEPYGGLNSYSRNKVLCEQILRAAHERGELAVTIIRPAYTYGEGRGPLHSLGGSTTYIDRLRKGKPIVVHGDGSSLWTACHRDDVARAFVVAAGNPQTYGKAYHTPGSEWLTWNEYHRQAAAAIGAPKPTLVHIPSELLARAAPQRAAIVGDNFQFHNIFDTSAAEADLAFVPQVRWAEGVRRMVAWLDAHGQIENSDNDPVDDRIIAAWQQLSTAFITALQ